MSRRIIVVSCLLCFLAIVLVKVKTVHHHKAACGGQSLGYWVGRHYNKRSDSDAEKAIKAIGADAIPDLILMLQRGPETNQYRALDAIAVLGPVAKPALPHILPLLTNQPLNVQLRAMYAFQTIEPDAESARSAVPVLTNALHSPDSGMRSAAIGALNAINPTPAEAVSEFFRLLQDPVEDVRDQAMASLVARTNALVIPFLNQQLREEDPYVVPMAAWQIGRFGLAASASVPRLRELCNDPMLNVRQAATNALHAITGAGPTVPASRKDADIEFNFQVVPMIQAIDIYESWAGKRVAMPEERWDSRTIRVRTAVKLTKEEALQVLEDAFRLQAHILIRHNSDGSLTAVAQ